MTKKKPNGSKETVQEMDLEQTDTMLAQEDPEAVNAEAREPDAVAKEGNDVSADETVLEEAKESIKEQELMEALATAQGQRDEYLNMAQRVQADFDNFRRRNQNVRKEAFDDGARTLVASLLPVVDNLERAIDAARCSPDTSLREGVEMVLRQFTEVLQKRGVEPICRLGEKFDPNLENAVLQGTVEEGEPGTVCEVFQKGYQMGEFVLRHAMVKVVPE
ncbi:MAG: nucleotide exchange factor GrpE [Clostridiales bacterium]|nr:nucleotide exchange factor GrpE [Clostridiales bacterium]